MKDIGCLGQAYVGKVKDSLDAAHTDLLHTMRLAAREGRQHVVRARQAGRRAANANA